MDSGLQGIGMTSQKARDRLISRLAEMGIRSADVLEAIRQVPRHLFIDEALTSRAYENVSLPIGFNQSISQPYVVARMLEAVLGSVGRARGDPAVTALIRAGKGKILEIGTGCGYQTALLSRLAGRVFSVERIAALLERARRTLRLVRARNVNTRCGDGRLGWPELAPYDGILVSAAPLSVPKGLPEQLGPGGRLAIPVGSNGVQHLLLITRTRTGYRERILDEANFVAMREGTD